MKTKFLYIENIVKIDHTSFYTAGLKAAQLLGWEVHVAFNCVDYKKEKMDRLQEEMDFTFHQIDFVRNPLHPGNIKAYSQLNKVFNTEHFDFIHCNTPVGGVLGRIIATRKKVKNIIYEAHGFHFYQGAPLINWLVFYPAELFLAHLTDVILTINQEDYVFAKKHLHSRRGIRYVPGVGIELNSDNMQKSAKQNRKQFGLDENDFVLLVVGRLEKNKNCKITLDALRQLNNKRVKIMFCGDGEDQEMLSQMAEQYKIKDQVIFLGYRSDMTNIYPVADCFILASFREGLSRSIMEAMSFGLPCVVSKIRGNVDLIDEQGGFLFDPYDAGALAKCIENLINSEEMQKSMSAYNLKKIRGFSLDLVINKLCKIYTEQVTVKNIK